MDTAHDGNGTRVLFPTQPQHQLTSCLYEVCLYCLKCAQVITEPKKIVQLTDLLFLVEHCFHNAALD